MNNKTIHMIAFLLLVVGGLNWLLVGVADIDLVAMLLGDGSTLSRVVYVLVGLAAIYELAVHKKTCVHCGAGGAHKSPGQTAGEPGAM